MNFSFHKKLLFNLLCHRMMSPFATPFSTTILLQVDILVAMVDLGNVESAHFLLPETVLEPESREMNDRDDIITIKSWCLNIHPPISRMLLIVEGKVSSDWLEKYGWLDTLLEWKFRYFWSLNYIFESKPFIQLQQCLNLSLIKTETQQKIQIFGKN